MVTDTQTEPTGDTHADTARHRHGLIGAILDIAVRFRWAVIVLTVFAAIYGAMNLLRLPIDAVPDITNTQVQINTSAPALSPSQVETQVTFPIETGLAGIEGLEMTRSISRNGFSQVTAIFEEDTDIYFARQQVNERLAPIGASLPEGAEPTMGPISTGLGEVLMYTIEYEYPGGRDAPKGGRTGWQPDGSFITERGDRLDTEVAKAAYLRTVQDWVVAPLMRSIDGVAGVDSIGGYEKQFLVQPDPARLTGYGLSFDSLIEALEAANLSEGANFVDRAGEALLVRVDARLGGTQDIEQAVVETREGVPIRIGDVASVRIGGDLRTSERTHASADHQTGRPVVAAAAVAAVLPAPHAVAAIQAPFVARLAPRIAVAAPILAPIAIVAALILVRAGGRGGEGRGRNGAGAALGGKLCGQRGGGGQGEGGSGDCHHGDLHRVTPSNVSVPTNSEAALRLPNLR